MWVKWNAPQAYTFYKEDINGKMLKYSFSAIKCVRHALSILIPTQCDLGFSKQFGQLGPGQWVQSTPGAQLSSAQLSGIQLSGAHMPGTLQP